MKKKLLILAGILLVGGFLGKSMFADAINTQSTKESWSITDKEINAIEVVGVSPELDVNIQQTNAAETVVQIDGEVSSKVAKELATTAYQNKKLTVKLGSDTAVGITVVANDQKATQVNILLGQDVHVANYKFTGVSAMNVKVPADFNGTYKLDTNHNGETSQPKTTQSDDTQLKVDTAGDITITK